MAKAMERRRSERYTVNAEFAELDPGSISFVSNLSEQGVFINTRARLPVGAAIDLRFTILLDDPVVISGTGRVVHLQDEPRGMGVAFHNLSAEMTLRVIDAIAWHRTREASRTAEPGFRTRELTAEELAQLEEGDEMAGESVTSLSASAVLSEDSLPAAARSGLARRGREDSLSRLGLDDSNQSLPPPPRFGASAPVPAARKAPPPPPKDDDYEDF
ncbi:PilZ domain-containing protein [Nannocystis sp. ILAH1]|uniref:PilZ domain-containing protein n=1 Tax=unclassified Nannocystis TaxID=2627009 RepID=UPI002270989B|nr:MULTISPECIES: PilZ domain-containing protein [unclassified Nannocystis]MCY0990856.1 PilZ domain-containing protein [Nannocystis sp. ILAH1]MCY1072385.1 PilZ domain-containing protein [Nannocystis sp. RBIL2]